MRKPHFLPGLAALCLACMTLAVGPVLAAPPADFRDLVKAAMPAVVNISTERTEEVRPFPRMPFEMFRGNPDVERFFEPFEEFYNAPHSRKMSSLGSGFIISPDGFVVTNNHVVEGADVIRVTISTKADKQEKGYPAEIVGADPETDLALLKIKARDLPYLTFGNSDVLEVGEWVVAIGSPLGLDHTVTAGIVSAKGRNIQSGSYDDFLQTDASINRGNSGGPLLNMAGEVAGINTAIAQRAQGIGFAIPSTLAQRIIGDLREHKKVSRGWLGVTIQNVDEAAAKALELPEARGALVNSVLDGQPAAQAGIKGGDVILTVNGKKITNTEELLRVVAQLRPGSQADLTVWRDGREEQVSLKVAERDLTQAKGKESGKSGPASGTPLGLKLRPVTSEDIRNNNLNGDSGLTVIRVAPDSVAEEAGIRPGDVILAADKQPVHSVEELSRRIETADKQRGVVLLHIVRKGQMFFRAIELKQKK